MRPLAALGKFVFSPTQGSYESLQKEWDFTYAKLDAIGQKPARQWMGIGDHKISIEGSIWPEIQAAATWKIEDMARIAGAGRPMPLVIYSGEVLGKFVVEKITLTHKQIGEAGLPGEIGFTINLTRV